jgi:hypothetical protein
MSQGYRGAAAAFVTSESAAGPSREFAFSNADFRSLAQFAYEQAGIALADSKGNLVYSRLSRRLRALGLLHRDQCSPAAFHQPESFAGLEHVVELAPRQSVGEAEPEDVVSRQFVDGGWRVACVCILDRHLRQQHVVGVVQNVANRDGDGHILGMCLRHDHQAGIAAVLVDRDYLLGRTEREYLSERRNRGSTGTVRTSARIICPTLRSRIQPTSAALRMVSPRRWKRQVAKEIRGLAPACHHADAWLNNFILNWRVGLRLFLTNRFSNYLSK